MPSGFYNKIAPANIKRSSFDLSHSRQFALDMGQLVVADYAPMVPNDIFDMSAECIIRFTPMISPVLAEINAYVHYFFVPYRLLFTGGEGTWMDFISGGITGDSEPSLPLYRPSSGLLHTSGSSPTVLYGVGLPNGTQKFSLWDYLGFPVSSVGGVDWLNAECCPVAFPFRAYNKIFNDWYRDPIVQPIERDLNAGNIAFRNLKKDYFVSALPSPQLGTAPTLPIVGTPYVQYASEAMNTDKANSVFVPASNTDYDDDSSGANSLPELVAGGGSYATDRPLYVDLGQAVSSNVNELRVLYATQRFMERNMISGGNVRMQDFLIAHFGIAPNDETLQRAEYIGGAKIPIIVSQVEQTSSSDATSPQGNLTGNGLGFANQKIGRYRAKEFGIVMAIMSIMPDTSYYGGIDREWLKRKKEDFLFPEFAELGADAVFTSQLYADPNTTMGTSDVFGYQGRYDEYRTMPNKICAGMYDSTFNPWNLARIISSKPALNDDFISGKWLSTSEGKRIFAVQEDDTTAGTAAVPATRNILVNFMSWIKAVRPLPYYPIA